MFFLKNAEVIRNDRVGDGLYELEFRAPQIASRGEPGQFIHVEVKPHPAESLSPLLRRPFSLYGVDSRQGAISILYRIRGLGTSILARAKPGECLSVLGPLGRGFTLPAMESVTLLVGGGMGIAPLVYLADCLTRLSCKVTVLYGAETASELVALEKLEQKEVKCHVATMDGSKGYEGFVTDLLTCVHAGESASMSIEKQADLLSGSPGESHTLSSGRTLSDREANDIHRQPDIIYSCGPLEMMAHVARFADERGIPGEVSLESNMACGVGVCLGCALKLKGGNAGYAKVCSDGPVFPMDRVEFTVGEEARLQ